MYTNDNTSIITCSECGCIIEGVDPIYVDGDAYCPDCAESLGFVQCDHCGKWYDPDHEDMIEYSGEIICESCRDDMNLAQCDECGEWYDPAYLTQVNGGWRNPDQYLCEGCIEDRLEHESIFYCDDCGEYYVSRVYNSYTTHDGSTVCESCATDHYYTCNDCGELFHENDVRYCEADDEYYCEDCYPDHSSRIHDYGFRPRPVFHGTPTQSPSFGDPITIGFELEVDDGDDESGCASEIMSVFDEDTLYLKHDSSVTFEIVTHPHTLRSYLEDFDLDTLCRIPQDYDFTSHTCGTCGLHMHVGRAQLGATLADRNRVIYRIALLMYRHWNSLVKFSRRREDQLSRWAHAPRFDFQPSISYNDERLYDLVREYYDCLGRYQALNLCNRGTIEFRLWRGSLKPNTVRATLQLTSNIVRYAMEHTLEDVVKSSWADITSFESYAELNDYLVDRDLVSGMDAKEIPYNNTVDEPVDNNDGFRYRIGDHVRFSRSHFIVHAAMIGQTGTIVYRDKIPGDVARYLIQLDPYTEARFLEGYCHGGDGRCPDRDGYWAYEDEISFSDPDINDVSGFRVGDRVVMNDRRENPNRRIGTIVICNDEFDIGVRFDGFTSGHDLGAGDGSCNGWWCYASQLSHAA